MKSERGRPSSGALGDARKAVATSTLGLVLIIVLLLGVVVYLGSTRVTSSSMSTTSSCPSTSMAMSSSSSSMMNTTQIIKNATTADYKLSLWLGPQEQMLQMCQYTTQTSGMVMIQGQMSNMTSTSSMMTVYHLRLYVFDVSTGATVTPPVSSVSVSITNSSGMSMSVPVVLMFDISQGPTSMHYGNNVALAAGQYTVTATVAGEKATFTVTVS